MPSVRCVSEIEENGMCKPLRGRKAWLFLFSILITNSTFVFSQSNIYTFTGEVDLGVHYAAFLSSGQHYIGARGDTVYVVTSDGGNVYCQKSTDGGQSFGLPVVVNSAPQATNPSMRVDTAGVIYVAYQLNADIYFSKSTDGGFSFTPAVKVNDDTIPEIGQEKPVIAVNNKGQIFIAWGDQRNAPPPTTKNLFFASSFDTGRTFGSNIQINDPVLPIVWGMDIATDDFKRVYVVWNSYLSSGNKGPIYLARSVDSGGNFGTETLVTDLPSDSTWARGFFPSLALGGEVVGVAWEDRRFEQYTLRFTTSNDFGLTFSPSIRVDDDADITDETAPLTPSMAYNKGILYVVWRDAGPNWRTSFSYSPNNGQSFLPSKSVSSFNSSQLFPSLTINGSGKAFVAWLDNRVDPIFSENRHTFVTWGIPQTVKGDLNLDGIITMVDIVMELNAIFLAQPFPAPFHTADGNCDETLSAADMVWLLYRYYLNTPFPCS